MSGGKWERIDANGDARSLTTVQEKKARQKFTALFGAVKQRRDWDPDKRDEIDEEPDLLVLGGVRRDGTQVKLIGRASDLHGPNGVCTCCGGRAS